MPHKDPQRRLEYQKEYRRLHHAHRATVRRAWVANNKDHVRAYHRAYSKRILQTDAGRIKNASVMRAYRWKLKIDVLKKYGAACVCCGERTPRFLTIDHVEKDGFAERKALYGKNTGGNGLRFYARLRNAPVNKKYQILCFNCNCASAHGKCPHKLIGPDGVEYAG